MAAHSINNSLNTHYWLELPQKVRSKLVTIFNIPRSGVGNVDYGPTGAVVTSDGYTHEDLKAISVEAMQKYLNSTETDFSNLLGGVMVWIDQGKEPIKTSNVQFSQEKMIQSWVDKIKDIRQEAEERGLITEYIKTLKNEIKVKK